MRLWKAKNGLATSIIFATLSEAVMDEVRNIRISKGLWDHLAGLYSDTGMASKFTRFQEWNSFYPDGKDTEGYLRKYSTLDTARRDAELTNDELAVFTIMDRLQPYHEGFIEAIRVQMRSAADRKEQVPFSTLKSFTEAMM